MSYTSQSLASLDIRVRKLENFMNNLLAGCNPCAEPAAGSVTYFNVVGEPGNTIVDNRFKNWDVALIAIDDEDPRNTGFTKDRASNTITLTTPLVGGETITIFLFKAPTSKSGGYPYTYPAVHGS